MKKELSHVQSEALLKTLETRFAKNMKRHKDVDWDLVQAKLEKNPAILWSLQQMEETGGEPDIVAFDWKTGEYTFYDCSPESPKGRTSLCYDDRALQSRKEHKPKKSAQGLAAEMGVKILTEAEYRALQEMGEFDTKSSTWVDTPDKIRKLGGALFCDRRFDTVFTYHNGAESYYAGRGFRSSLKV